MPACLNIMNSNEFAATMTTSTDILASKCRLRRSQVLGNCWLPKDENENSRSNRPNSQSGLLTTVQCMTTFDSPIIRAFFTEDVIESAQKLSAQSPLVEVAAGVYRITVDDFEVQVDGFTFPGCTSCQCDGFRTRKSCAHVCFGVATMLAEHPSIKEVLWPDTNAAMNPDLLEPDCYYELKMLPMTYSPSCQGGRTLAESILDKASQCHGVVDDARITDEVKRLFQDYFELPGSWDPDIRRKEIEALIAELHDLGVDDKEIRTLVSEHPGYSDVIPRRWWPRSWWITRFFPSNWRLQT